MKLIKYFYTLLLLWGTQVGIFAQTSEIKELVYLSGTDVKNTKTWDFWVSKGRNSGYWSSIEVPSHWEQQGFGDYDYGRNDFTNGKNFSYHDEKGFYRHEFDVPAAWKDKEVYVVFEGSMTDTQVKVNGQFAGAVHQGAFYRFKYNIGDKLVYGAKNKLEVTVSKMSADKSVNNAERLADFWIFGGIYRPVYLEAVPKEHIEWTSIDAKATGAFSINVYMANAVPGHQVVASVIDADGKEVGTAKGAVTAKNSVVTLTATVKKPALWTAETPHLYSVNLAIKDGARVLYTASDKFGFRTIEVRKEDGIYVNGKKIKIKGVNRHVFWPEYGRATYPEADLIDVKLIKEMNMNAVRCSHYPPDANFLRVCDSLGLYVIDELAGWQKAYSTQAGIPLVKEMVVRDANHPSVLFWSNGNEGGHNKELVAEFAKYDLSGRTVIHAHHKPGNAINGIDCNHYEDYYSAEKIIAGENIYMPTEFLHAMHDGGAGAGLADMWELHWNSKKGAGGFIWDLADEGVVRTDLNNVIDVNGINAADGIVGPHREKEGSVNAIREIYSPVKILLKELPDNFKGAVPVENRFNFINLNQCTFTWELINFNGAYGPVGHKVAKTASLKGPDVGPFKKGNLILNLPADWQNFDALAIKAIDHHGEALYRWVWKVKPNAVLLQGLLTQEKVAEPVSLIENDSIVTLKANGISIGISKGTGMLLRVTNEYSADISFGNGPVLVSGNATFKQLRHYKDDTGYVIEARYSGDLQFVKWKMLPNGWVEMTYQYNLNGTYPFAGITFNYPEGLVIGAKWLGKGPYRVWKNRLAGVTFDVYESMYNNTQTGRSWVYPEFKGYFADMVWMELGTIEGKFTIASPDNALFVRLFDFYAINGKVPHPSLPLGNISFLDAIPATGSKMGTRTSQVKGFGPQSDVNAINGSVERTLFFYFGTPKTQHPLMHYEPK